VSKGSHKLGETGLQVFLVSIVVVEGRAAS